MYVLTLNGRVKCAYLLWHVMLVFGINNIFCQGKLSAKKIVDDQNRSKKVTRFKESQSWTDKVEKNGLGIEFDIYTVCYLTGGSVGVMTSGLLPGISISQRLTSSPPVH